MRDTLTLGAHASVSVLGAEAGHSCDSLMSFMHVARKGTKPRVQCHRPPRLPHAGRVCSCGVHVKFVVRRIRPSAIVASTKTASSPPCETQVEPLVRGLCESRNRQPLSREGVVGILNTGVLLDFEAVETEHVCYTFADGLAGVVKVAVAVLQAGDLALQVTVLVPFAISKLGCVEQGFALFDDACVSHEMTPFTYEGKKQVVTVTLHTFNVDCVQRHKPLVSHDLHRPPLIIDPIMPVHTITTQKSRCFVGGVGGYGVARVSNTPVYILDPLVNS